MGSVVLTPLPRGLWIGILVTPFSRDSNLFPIFSMVWRRFSARGENLHLFSIEWFTPPPANNSARITGFA